MSSKIVDHEDQVILTKESYSFTSVSVDGSINNNTPIPSLFLQYLYKLQGLSLYYLQKTPITILRILCIYEITSTKEHILS